MDPTTAKALLDLGVTGLLIVVIAAGSRRWWAYGRELRALEEAHSRELAERDQRVAQIRADCDRERAEWVAVRDRLIEVALRSTAAGEKVAEAAQRTVGSG